MLNKFKKNKMNKLKVKKDERFKLPWNGKIGKLIKSKKATVKKPGRQEEYNGQRMKKSMSLRTRLIGSLIIFAALPVIVVSILSAQANTKAIEKSVGSYSQSMVEQFGHTFDNMIDQTRNSLTQFMLMQSIQRTTLLKESERTNESLKEEMKIDGELQKLLHSNGLLQGVIIATSNDRVFYKDSPNGVTEEIKAIESGGLFQSQTMNNLQENKDPMWFSSLEEGINGIYLGWTYSSYPPGSEGVFIAAVSKEAIQESIDVFSVEGVSNFYIADENRNIIIGLDEEDVGQNLELEYIDKVYGEVLTETLTEDGKLVSFYTLKNGWKAIYEAPLSVLMEDVIKARNQTVMVAVIFILLAIFIGFAIAMSILRPLNRLSDAMAEAETGNLGVEYNYNSDNEIGRLVRSFNQMINNIKALVSDTKTVAETIETNTETLQVVSESTAMSSNQITQAIESIATGTESQTVQIVQSTQMMENLSENINLATQKVQGVQEVANSTMEVSNNTVSTMEELTAQSERTIKISSEIERHIEELGDEASQITNVIGMIQSISEQTNLLALNATIEAARAGEAGRGFGVVADEIRKLANQSKDATTRIEEIIISIMNKKDTSIQGARDATNLIAMQRPIVDNTNQAFEKIHEEMERVVTQLDELRDLFGSITRHKDDTVVAISEISDIIGNSASAAEEVFATSAEQSTAADSIADMANILLRGVEELKASQQKFRL